MNESDDLSKTIDTLMAGVALQGAAIEAMTFLCCRLAERVGISEIDGLAPDDWLQRQKLLQLEEYLVKLEDRDPGYAAALQQIVDDGRARNAKKSPPADD